MAQNDKEQSKATDGDIVDCVVRATAKIKDFAAFSGNITDNISKNILGIEPAGKGIKIDRDDEGIKIDLYIIVNFGAKIPQLAWEIQKKVKNQVEKKTGINVKIVNIHVQSVSMSGE
ncbi:MAG: Asp23/Gls24 family envelope stress response protein [Peptostreptococcaceae bacterium]|nr:Asp23/Gls24 family envelope stress response protein [Peptostreptococcaceae bacterium]MDY5739003.1 Asp23/Gls24 family envelope stress response protein [Anaerovoracaceae bacterium]